MNLNEFMKNYAHQINGQYTEYDASHSIIIVPLSGNRFQTVLGKLKNNELYNRELVIFSSKICLYKPNLALHELLKQASLFNYSRFVIDHDGYLKIEAVAFDHSEKVMTEMVQEVANLADQYELKMTGIDVH